MKIFSKQQIYEGDRLTAQRQNISSTDLMERAGTQIFNWMHLRMQGAQVPIHVFCGIGNNGGDGLVLARHLKIHGYNVKTYVVNCGNRRSDDFLVNYERLKEVSKSWPELIKSAAEFPGIASDDIIVDAIFGIGLNKPVEAWIQELFLHFKKSEAFTLSIDIPSGLYSDKPTVNEKSVVFANYTLSFQTPKLVFFLPDTAKFTSNWEILDIGIDQEYLQNTETEAELISKHELLPIYKPREKFSHKGDFGHGLIIGGSYGKIGAVYLATKSVLTIGAGLATAYLPKCGYQSLQTSLPEAMVITSDNETIIDTISFEFEPTAIGLGVGLGTNEQSVKAFKGFLKTNKRPLVIDADGLNIISQHKDLAKLLKKDTILTPHPKELERLIGPWRDDFEKLEKTKTFSKKHKAIIVIKGANTITVNGNKYYINVTGNPGMATGGSGDVLTGIIVGLLCQKYSPLEATLFGVYLHGRSGDIALETYGYHSLIASNIIDHIKNAYLDLFSLPEIAEETNNEEENTN